MKWSFKIARIAGIDVRVHATFLILLAWVGFGEFTSSGDPARALSGILFILVVFGIVVMHEFGHALTARRFGIKTRDITLLPIGGVAQLEKMPENPREEVLVALAGPAVNVLLAAILGLWIALTDGAGAVFQTQTLTSTFVGQLMLINVGLAVFNMVPAFPMDGGRVLRALLAFRLDRVTATQIAAKLGQGLALLFGLIGLFVNPFLLFIALFVWMGAAGEANATEMNAALRGISVRQGMITEFHAVEVSDPIARPVGLILHGFQADFPVVEGAGVIGMLTREDVIKTLSEQGPQAPVSTAMTTDYRTADPAEPLQKALERLQECRCRSMPVLAQGRLVGVLTLENVAEVFMVQSALSKANERKSPNVLRPRAA